MSAVNWRDEYDAAIIERNGLIMRLMAAEESRDKWEATAFAAEKRAGELEEILGNTITVTVDGVIYRAFPEPWGYTGTGD